MDQDEKRIKQEDCGEDKLGAGILTLTSKRLAFDKTNARIMDFSKHFGDTVMDVPLNKVTETWKEGLFIKKVCITAQTEQGLQTFKFGVFNTKGWLKNIKEAIGNSGSGVDGDGDGNNDNNNNNKNDSDKCSRDKDSGNKNDSDKCSRDKDSGNKNDSDKCSSDKDSGNKNDSDKDSRNNNQ